RAGRESSTEPLGPRPAEVRAMPSRQLALALGLWISIGCGSVSPEAPSHGAGGMDATSGPGSGVGGSGGDFGTGGSQVCGTELDREGCACSADEVSTIRHCYPGDPDQAGKGVCTFGQQQCLASGNAEVSDAVWGACLGAGQPTGEATICDGTDGDCDGSPDVG